MKNWVLFATLANGETVFEPMDAETRKEAQNELITAWKNTPNCGRRLCERFGCACVEDTADIYAADTDSMVLHDVCGCVWGMFLDVFLEQEDGEKEFLETVTEYQTAREYAARCEGLRDAITGNKGRVAIYSNGMPVSLYTVTK